MWMELAEARNSVTTGLPCSSANPSAVCLLSQRSVKSVRQGVLVSCAGHTSACEIRPMDMWP
jgi:hypothetical protein